MNTIKLSAILTEDFVPVRFKIPSGRHAELLDYLSFFNEVHGSAVDLHALLPHLVAAFLAEDRAFAKWRTGRQEKTVARDRPPKRPADTKAKDLPVSTPARLTGEP